MSDALTGMKEALIGCGCLVALVGLAVGVFAGVVITYLVAR